MDQAEFTDSVYNMQPRTFSLGQEQFSIRSVFRLGWFDLKFFRCVLAVNCRKSASFAMSGSMLLGRF